MRTTLQRICCTLLCASAAANLQAQTVIENFEYANEGDMLAVWTPQASAMTLSSYVAAGSTGTNSLQVSRYFYTSLWENEVLSGPVLATPISIPTNHYLTFRFAGGPEFASASFRKLYVYAYDGSGNYGRWGAVIPLNTDWQYCSFKPGSVELPYGSPALPNLADIVQFKVYIFGQGDPAGGEFNGTIYFDDLMIRPAPAIAERTIYDFEYATDADLLADWIPGAGTLAVSSNTDPNSPGDKSMAVTRTFGANPWETENITGPTLSEPVSIGPDQYLALRIAGDPEFAKGSYKAIYIYAYDGDGNFGRWGGNVPVDANWHTINFLASDIGDDWQHLPLPDMNNLRRFDMVVYGQGDPVGTDFTATLHMDDLMVRNAPVFPPASPARGLIDDFESYANDEALMNFYDYINSTWPDITTTVATLQAPAPQGNKALKMAINFGSGQYPWGSIMSPVVAPFSFPRNAVVRCRVKGDPILAPLADEGTSFWIQFYDGAGNSFNYYPTPPAYSAEWVTLTAGYDEFEAWGLVDTGNLVQWQVDFQGWLGTETTPGLAGNFYVDDIAILVPPMLTVVKEGTSLKLRLENLIPAVTYTIRQTTNFATWTNAGTVPATSSTATWPIPAGEKAFYQVTYTP